MNPEESSVYKAHQIHTTQLIGGSWITSIVKLGVPKQGNAGPPVERIRGDHPSKDEAISAAKRYIDAFQQMNATENMAETDIQLAAVYYWRGRSGQRRTRTDHRCGQLHLRGDGQAR